MRAATAITALLALTAPLAAQEGGQSGAAPGKATYERWCAGCHGVDGAGEGPGATRMLPRPRDFTRAQYQIRTTASGELPTDADILHVIDVGMPGTAMPGWEDVLTTREREDLVTYLKSLSRFFGNAEAPPPLEFGSAPGSSEEVIAEGRDLYQQIECWKCHGQMGRGDGTSAPTLEDDGDFPIYAADLTRNWRFNGGGRVEDIYRRLRTGLDGTPMPTFSDLIDAGIVTDEQLWSLAHYVRSLSPARTPAVREVVAAERVEPSALPSTPDAEAWAEVERYWIPLAGQIVVEPRWFSPRVSGLWVQALHDGEELALLVSWTDPSRSPDPAWGSFAARVQEVMEPDEGEPWAPGAPDQLVVQFPQQVTSGMERPYFLQGDGRRPVYLWHWRSDRDGAREQVARGMGTAEDQPSGSQQVQATAAWADGEWRVLFRRPVTTPDSADDLQFPTATALPMAFQAWDGDNAESSHRAAVSTWYFVALRDATPVAVYAAPILALLVTVGLGLLLVARARRREREAPAAGAEGRAAPGPVPQPEGI